MIFMIKIVILLPKPNGLMVFNGSLLKMYNSLFDLVLLGIRQRFLRVSRKTNRKTFGVRYPNHCAK